MSDSPTPLNPFDPPPFGTLVVYRGVEAVYVANNRPLRGCGTCAYNDFCGDSYDKVSIECPGGVYADKLTYMQLKLVGDVE